MTNIFIVFLLFYSLVLLYNETYITLFLMHIQTYNYDNMHFLNGVVKDKNAAIARKTIKNELWQENENHPDISILNQ